MLSVCAASSPEWRKPSGTQPEVSWTILTWYDPVCGGNVMTFKAMDGLNYRIDVLEDYAGYSVMTWNENIPDGKIEHWHFYYTSQVWIGRFWIKFGLQFYQIPVSWDFDCLNVKVSISQKKIKFLQNFLTFKMMRLVESQSNVALNNESNWNPNFSLQMMNDRFFLNVIVFSPILACSGVPVFATN